MKTKVPVFLALAVFFALCFTAARKRADSRPADLRDGPALSDVVARFGGNADGGAPPPPPPPPKEQEDGVSRRIDNSGYAVFEYHVRGEKVTVDNARKLMWVIDAAKMDREYSWTDAKKECERLDYAGYSDWRLPTQKELLGIVRRGESPTVDRRYFPDTRKGYYWSSRLVHRSNSDRPCGPDDQLVNDESRQDDSEDYSPYNLVCAVDFRSGFGAIWKKATYHNTYVRCVRTIRFSDINQ